MNYKNSDDDEWGSGGEYWDGQGPSFEEGVFSNDDDSSANKSETLGLDPNNNQLNENSSNVIVSQSW